MFVDMDRLTDEIISAALLVHKALGAGRQELVYREHLCHELSRRAIPFERHLPLPMEYKGIHLTGVYRVELLVAESVVVKVKAVDVITSIHEGQLLLDLWLGGWNVGLLINFDASVLEIHQRVLEMDD